MAGEALEMLGELVAEVGAVDFWEVDGVLWILWMSTGACVSGFTIRMAAFCRFCCGSN